MCSAYRKQPQLILVVSDWLARLTCVVIGCAVAVSLFENAQMIRSLAGVTVV